MKVLRKQEIETANIQVGDQVIIPLAEIGEFSATAHKVTDEGIMFIFDEYITRQMYRFHFPFLKALSLPLPSPLLPHLPFSSQEALTQTS